MKSSKRVLVVAFVAAFMLTLLSATLVAADGPSLSSSSASAAEASAPSESPDAVVSMTHSVSQSIVQFNSVSCNAGGLHADNSYWRVFDVEGDFGVTTALDVTDIEIGIETSTAGNPTAEAGGGQPMTINLYTLDGAFNTANLTLIGTANHSVADTTLSVVSFAVAGQVPAGGILVVEVNTPDGQNDGHQFFIGSNNLGQTDDSYLSAAACGITEPTATGAIGFPDMHIIINVYGDTVVPTDVSLVGFEASNASTLLPLVLGLVALAAAGTLVARRRTDV